MIAVRGHGKKLPMKTVPVHTIFIKFAQLMDERKRLKMCRKFARSDSGILRKG